MKDTNPEICDTLLPRYDTFIFNTCEEKDDHV